MERHHATTDRNQANQFGPAAIAPRYCYSLAVALLMARRRVALESRSHVRARNTVIHSFVVGVMIWSGSLVTASARWLVPDWMIHPPPLFPTNEWGVVANSCQLGLRIPKFQFELGEQIVPTVILR